jgi:hypothetical protein
VRVLHAEPRRQHAAVAAAKGDDVGARLYTYRCI